MKTDEPTVGWTVLKVIYCPGPSDGPSQPIFKNNFKIPKKEPKPDCSAVRADRTLPGEVDQMFPHGPLQQPIREIKEEEEEQIPIDMKKEPGEYIEDNFKDECAEDYKPEFKALKSEPGSAGESADTPLLPGPVKTEIADNSVKKRIKAEHQTSQTGPGKIEGRAVKREGKAGPKAERPAGVKGRKRKRSFNSDVDGVPDAKRAKNDHDDALGKGNVCRRPRTSVKMPSCTQTSGSYVAIVEQPARSPPPLEDAEALAAPPIVVLPGGDGSSLANISEDCLEMCIIGNPLTFRLITSCIKLAVTSCSFTV